MWIEMSSFHPWREQLLLHFYPRIDGVMESFLYGPKFELSNHLTIMRIETTNFYPWMEHSSSYIFIQKSNRFTESFMGPMTGPTLVIEQNWPQREWRQPLFIREENNYYIFIQEVIGLWNHSLHKWESWHWLQRLSIIDDNENRDGFFSSTKEANLLHFHTRNDKVTESFIGPMNETTLAPIYQA